MRYYRPKVKRRDFIKKVIQIKRMNRIRADEYKEHHKVFREHTKVMKEKYPDISSWDEMSEEDRVATQSLFDKDIAIHKNMLSSIFSRRFS